MLEFFKEKGFVCEGKEVKEEILFKAKDPRFNIVTATAHNEVKVLPKEDLTTAKTSVKVPALEPDLQLI